MNPPPFLMHLILSSTGIETSCCTIINTMDSLQSMYKTVKISLQPWQHIILEESAKSNQSHIHHINTVRESKKNFAWKRGTTSKSLCEASINWVCKTVRPLHSNVAFLQKPFLRQQVYKMIQDPTTLAQKILSFVYVGLFQEENWLLQLDCG